MSDYGTTMQGLKGMEIPAWAEGREERRDAGEDSSSFMDALKGAVNGVNDLQHKSGQAVTDFYAGKIQDIHTVALAMKKSSIGFRYLLAVRQKAMEAYQELTRLNV